MTLKELIMNHTTKLTVAGMCAGCSENLNKTRLLLYLWSGNKRMKEPVHYLTIKQTNPSLLELVEGWEVAK